MIRNDLRALTTGEFLHALRQVVAEKGASYVYPSSERDARGVCHYWRNGQPSCIIGHALDALGVVVPPKMEGESAHEVLSDLGAPERVGKVAMMAQATQDLYGTWGEALAEAELVGAQLAVSA